MVFLALVIGIAIGILLTRREVGYVLVAGCICLILMPFQKLKNLFGKKYHDPRNQS